MKTYKKLFISGLVMVTFLSFVGKASAITPILSLSPTGGTYTDNVIVNVIGDPNSSVILYTISGLPKFLGTTNNNGLLSVTISTNGYGIIPGGSAYIMVNGQQSSSLAWPNSSSSSSFYLSQTNLSLSLGQTFVVTAYNTYGTPYLSNNSNQSVATATISGNLISVYGRNTGNTTLIFCQNNNTNSCSTVYVSVGGSSMPTTNTTLGLNISNIVLPVGSSATISSNNSTGLYVSNNSNSSVTSALASSFGLGCTATSLYNVITGQPCFNSINNNNGSVTISALSVGFSTILLCQGTVNTYGNICGTTFVTVTGIYSTIPTYTPSTIIDPGYSTVPIVYSR